MDPLKEKYPSLSPFQFAVNSPISVIDLKGLEGFRVVRKYESKSSQPKVSVVKDKSLGYGMLGLTVDRFDNGTGFGGYSEMTQKAIQVRDGTVSFNTIFITRGENNDPPEVMLQNINSNIEEKIVAIKQDFDKLKGQKITTTNSDVIEKRYEGKNFEVNYTNKTTTLYGDYKLKTNIEISGASNSKYVRDLTRGLEESGYTVTFSKTENSDIINGYAVPDKENPNGLSLSLTVDAQWQKSEDNKITITSVKDVESGEEIITPTK